MHFFLINLGLYAKFKALKNQNPDLKILLSIGNNQPEKYEYLLTMKDDYFRKSFAKSAVKLLKENGFDGLDIGWDDTTDRYRNYEETISSKFVEFLRILYNLFEKNDLILSAHLSVFGKHIPNLQVHKISDYVDFINVATFLKENTPNLPAKGYALHSLDKSDLMTIDNVIHNLLKWGADPRKIVIGLSTYGVHQRGDIFDSKQGKMSKGNLNNKAAFHFSTKLISYNEICLKTNISKTLLHDIQKLVSFVANGDKYTFDDERSFTVKVRILFTLQNR
ncbi:chitotriosidase-1-like protein [Dinothrombium tinctorium]|uniref:Chitotriosidase-1-like protein n=1 Tax=Dinothrombium tinctorium TaxID=1965070 RepID=A0A443RB24_9ACAR|nr:chitotriosidase-1-like protein [Dinothrombium tinctorium]